MEYSAILCMKFPPKLKHLDYFSILCIMGNSHFGKALCDLCVSIKLMPYTLANRTITHPCSIAKDVQVTMGKFIFSYNSMSTIFGHKKDSNRCREGLTDLKTG
ncbi:hypothetical protein CR513_38268, partial [Mucuna pruriens]